MSCVPKEAESLAVLARVARRVLRETAVAPASPAQDARRRVTHLPRQARRAPGGHCVALRGLRTVPGLGHVLIELGLEAHLVRVVARRGTVTWRALL